MAGLGKLSGKAAIVTGASRGIGWHIARRLCREGARVLAVARSMDDEAMRLLEREGECSFLACDLSQPDEAQRVVPACLERYGQVDIVCNNAATQGARHWIHEDTVDNWYTVLQTNVVSAFLICRDAIGHMLERSRGGRIVNIAAIQASLPLPRHGAYAASKGALISLTKSLAVEYAKDGIVSNAIDVGCILSEGMQAFMAAEGALPTAGKAGAPESGSSPAGRALGQGLGSPPLAATLNRRFGAPEEIAALVSFLVSDENTHIVGEVIRADGGRSISRLADPY